MGEAHSVALGHQHPRLLGLENGLKRIVHAWKRRNEHLDRRSGEGRSREHDIMREHRQPADPFTCQLLDASRHGQRLVIFVLIRILRERASDLNRKERIAAGSLGDSRHRGAAERPTEAFTDDVMQRGEREGPEADALEALRRNGAVEIERHLRIAIRAPRQKQPDRRRKPARRECECPVRRGVHPLHIVDRNQEQAARAQARQARRRRPWPSCEGQPARPSRPAATSPRAHGPVAGATRREYRRRQARPGRRAPRMRALLRSLRDVPARRELSEPQPPAPRQAIPWSCRCRAHLRSTARDYRLPGRRGRQYQQRVPAFGR